MLIGLFDAKSLDYCTHEVWQAPSESPCVLPTGYEEAEWCLLQIWFSVYLDTLRIAITEFRISFGKSIMYILLMQIIYSYLTIFRLQNFSREPLSPTFT